MSVKKLFLSVAIIGSLLGTVQKANAQAAIIALIFGDQVASEHFNLSMEVGGNFSQYSDLSDINQNKFGINFGIAGNIMLSQNWFLSPTAYFLSSRNIGVKSYSLHTASSSLNENFTDKEALIKLKYIDVPVIISYQTNNKKFRFGLGPQISFLTDANMIIDGDYGKFNEDYKSEIEDLDYGILSSIGYSLGEARKGKGLFIQLQYYQGFADVFKEATGMNRGSYFSVHISLPFITEELAQKNLNHTK